MKDFEKLININGDDILDERTFRKNLLKMAKAEGCEMELRQIFNKFDLLLQNCTNDKERKGISELGIIEVSKLIDNLNVGKGGCLTINGKTVIIG